MLEWNREHVCAPTVQELLELFNLESVDDLEIHSDLSEQMFLAVSQDALQGIEGPKTMKFHGSIQGLEVLILVDSGSSNTFVSHSIASKLSGVESLSTPVKVQVANGSVLQCSSKLSNAVCFVGEYSFTSDLKVLPLHHFDIILGMDWLEEFSPMKVHWQQKLMAIPYNGATAFLQGVQPSLPDEVVVHVCSIMDIPLSSVCSDHPDIATLLAEFDFLFEPLSSMPPQRHCDHVIPLVPGAKPVHIWPYRYPLH